jgi:hypothetical protein
MIGDHLSLFLFDLVIDVFCQILKKERYARYIQQKIPNWKGAMLSLGEVDFTELCTYC